VSYVTAGQLRTQLGVTDVVLSDDAASVLIEDACDIVDQALGARSVDSDTGRKVVESDVEAWQWLKLQRATLKVAARLYSQPVDPTGGRWNRMKGPDFEVEGRVGSLLGTDVEAVLDQSGLRRLTTTLAPVRSGLPPWYGFAYNDPFED
jgi:hypothetical protein